MVKSNYTFEKRQKELAKKKKKEEKRLKKLAATTGNDQSDQPQSDNNTPNIKSHTSDLDACQFLYAHLEAVTSIWDSNYYTETQ